MFFKNKFVKVYSAVLILVLSISFCVFTVSASSEFTVENGVLLSYNGSAKNVSVPSDVYFIADNAFKDNKSIRSVELNNVTIIGNDAFRNCTSLADVTEYDNLSSCGAFAFYGTPFQEQNPNQDLVMGSVLVHSKASGVYTIPENIKAISPYAFAQNKKLTSIAIGDNVSSVGEGAFWNCSALEAVSVSSKVSHIGGYAFEGTKYLNSVTDEFLVLGNGILVDVNSEDESVVIPSDVKQIGAASFAENSSLKSVAISEGVTSIGKGAFAQCTSLESVQLPASVVSVEAEAFYNCTSLKEVTIPETVKILGDSVFLGCTSLENARVCTDAPISTGLFAGCTKLRSVMISANTESVGSYAFYGCESLQEMSLPGSVSFIAQNAFDGCDDLTVWCDTDEHVGDILKQYGVKVNEIGDCNSDGKLNVRDSTHIRKSVAGLLTLDFSAELKADTDFNGVINVRDATSIQKKLVGVD
ncbi:MAG: leucine-rich repeat protein [Ruminococcus sp.]|nr:leucine-rich repeat protein [Ruminococcus sp.]